MVCVGGSAGRLGAAARWACDLQPDVDQQEKTYCETSATARRALKRELRQYGPVARMPSPDVMRHMRIIRHPDLTGIRKVPVSVSQQKHVSFYVLVTSTRHTSLTNAVRPICRRGPCPAHRQWDTATWREQELCYASVTSA